jgi:hypothetical protein
MLNIIRSRFADELGERKDSDADIRRISATNAGGVAACRVVGPQARDRD